MNSDLSIGRGHLIAGRWIAGAGEPFHAVDPSNGQTHPEPFFDAEPAQIDAALAAATDAHQRWRRAPRHHRARLLDTIAARIEALGDPLLHRARAETGLPLPRLRGERGRTVSQLRLFAEVVREGSHLQARIDRALPTRSPIPRPDLRRMLIPLGPVAVFGASNFPLAFSVAGGDTASALAAGCPVVVKAHPAHPGTSDLVAGAIAEAIEHEDAPPGLFSCIHGRAHAIGERLVTHPQIRAVAFTGSLVGGRALHALGSSRPDPIPVFAEMGSINPVVLLPGSLAEQPEALADTLLGSVTQGAGQFCTNPGLLLALAGPSTETFIARLAERADSIEPMVMLHAGIADAFANAGERLEHAGATRLTRADGPRSGHAATRPVIWRTTASAVIEQPALHEECFGPSTLIALADDVAQLRTTIAELPGQLTATIHAGPDDRPVVEQLLPALEERAGRVLFGGVPTGVEVAPAMHHGGPWPATTDARFTSVGTAAVARFMRPLCWQNAPAALLPEELRDGNPTGIPRLVDGED